MNFQDAVKFNFKNYAKFSGRASRSEFWYFMLFLILCRLGLLLIDIFVLGSIFHPLSSLFGLVMLIPSLAVSVRRLHDLDRTGWWLLIDFTIIGALFPILYWECLKGTTGDNRFGTDPLA